MVENPLKNPLYMGPNKLRWKDLTDDDVYTTPYAVAIAAPPSDDTLRIMWIVESTCLLLISISIALVFSSIILSKKARSTPFNLYLLFLSFPDWVYSFLCFLTCLLCAIKGDYFSEMMCHAQSVYLIFGTASNCWLNAIIAYEVHRLLQASKVTRRYTPPSNKSVYQRSVFAYALSLALAFSTLFGTVVWESYPMTIGANYGFVCIPTQDTTKDMIYFFLFFIPLYVGVPFGYVFWVCYDVLFRSKLLPEHGQRRDIAVYFFRISFVFLLFWTPSILVIYIFRSSHWWLRYGIGLLSHFQGMASAGVSLMKSDIMEAFQNLISCRWQEANSLYVEEHRLLRNGMRRSVARILALSSKNFRISSGTSGGGGGESSRA